jgi:hypothetical protein
VTDRIATYLLRHSGCTVTLPAAPHFNWLFCIIASCSPNTRWVFAKKFYEK